MHRQTAGASSPADRAADEPTPAQASPSPVAPLYHGSDVVLLAAGDYAALLEGRGQADPVVQRLGPQRIGPVASWWRRLPAFWSDIPVCNFLTIAHREMTIAEAAAACEERFGRERCPSKSAISRYWMVHDEALRARQKAGA